MPFQASLRELGRDLAAGLIAHLGRRVFQEISEPECQAGEHWRRGRQSIPIDVQVIFHFSTWEPTALATSSWAIACARCVPNLCVVFRRPARDGRPGNLREQRRRSQNDKGVDRCHHFLGLRFKDLRAAVSKGYSRGRMRTATRSPDMPCGIPKAADAGWVNGVNQATSAEIVVTAAQLLRGLTQLACSMCLAANGETVPAGQLSVSTSNRNFVGPYAGFRHLRLRAPGSKRPSPDWPGGFAMDNCVTPKTYQVASNRCRERSPDFVAARLPASGSFGFTDSVSQVLFQNRSLRDPSKG
jgi:hypothetical protein